VDEKGAGTRLEQFQFDEFEKNFDVQNNNVFKNYTADNNGLRPIIPLPPRYRKDIAEN